MRIANCTYTNIMFFLITHFMCKQHVCWCVDMYSLLKWCEFSVTFIIFVRVQLNIVFVTCGFHNPLVLGLFHVKDTLVHRHQSSPLAQYSCASSKDVPVYFKSYFTMLCQSCSVFPAFACTSLPGVWFLLEVYHHSSVRHAQTILVFFPW